MKKKASMKLKIIGILLPVVAVMMLLIVLVNYLAARNIAVSDAEKNLKAESAGITSEVDGWLKEDIGKLTSVKNTLESVDMDREQLLKFLKTTSSLSENIPLGVYMANGKEIISTLHGRRMKHMSLQSRAGTRTRLSMKT